MQLNTSILHGVTAYLTSTTQLVLGNTILLGTHSNSMYVQYYVIKINTVGENFIVFYGATSTVKYNEIFNNKAI